MTAWGRSTTTGSAFRVEWQRAMGGQFGGSDGTLDSVEIYNGNSHSGDIRVAVYTGGTLSDPNGASLLEDLGVLTGGGAADWDVIASSTNPTISANAIVWIHIHSGNAQAADVIASTSSADSGDFQSARGRAHFGGFVDPTTAPPSTLGSATFSDFWYAWRLNFTASGGGGGTTIAQGLQRIHDSVGPQMSQKLNGFLQ